MQKTKLYDNDPTKLYQNSDNRTQLYGDFGTDEHGLEIGQKIELNGKNYTVSSIISTDSGEAVIYKVQNAENQIFALKMYFEFQSEKDEPNPEALRRISQISSADLLKLHDFGVGGKKFEGKYAFEISDFAEGGDLLSVENFTKKYDTKFIEKILIPQIFKGIRTLHRNKIFHCDLKPQNVFFQDSERTNLVIGDYGSAKTFEFENGKDARKTSTVRGTDFYLPPEQARGFISEKNDYYSFGMILLHLVYPEKVCNPDDYTKLSRQKLKDIIVKQFENEAIIDFDESKGRINDLIQGLTLNNVLDRWGETEVEKWLKGEKVEIKKSSQNGIKTINPIDLGDRVIRTEKDFARFLEEDEEWYELLFEDHTGHQLYDRWLLSLRGEKERQEVSELVKKYQQQGIEFIKEALLRFFEPLRPLRLHDDWFDLSISDDLKFDTAYYLACLVNSDLSENELQIESFKFLQYFRSQNNRLDFKELLRLIENTRNIADPMLPRTHDIPRAKYTKDWLIEMIWEFASPLSVDDTQLKITYLDFEEGKIHCVKWEVLERYFTEKGKDILVEKYAGKETFELPAFRFQMPNDAREKSFLLSGIITQSQQKVYKQINSSKIIQFQDFENFELLVKNVKSKFWKYYWSGQFYRIGLNHITPAKKTEEKVNADYKLYQISYFLQTVNREVSYKNGEIKIRNQGERTAQEYKVGSDLLTSNFIKKTIDEDIKNNDRVKKIIINNIDNQLFIYSYEFDKVYQNFIGERKDISKRRKFFTVIAYPSLMLFQFEDFLPPDLRGNISVYFFVGLGVLLLSGVSILTTKDWRWLVNEIPRYIAFICINLFVLGTGHWIAVIGLILTMIVFLFKELEDDKIAD